MNDTQDLPYEELHQRGKEMVFKRQLGRELEWHERYVSEMSEECSDGTAVFKNSGKRFRIEKNPDGTTKRMTRIS